VAVQDNSLFGPVMIASYVMSLVACSWVFYRLYKKHKR
jgi:hypothetical protein